MAGQDKSVWLLTPCVALGPWNAKIQQSIVQVIKEDFRFSEEKLYYEIYFPVLAINDWNLWLSSVLQVGLIMLPRMMLVVTFLSLWPQTSYSLFGTAIYSQIYLAQCWVSLFLIWAQETKKGKLKSLAPGQNAMCDLAGPTTGYYKCFAWQVSEGKAGLFTPDLVHSWHTADLVGSYS